MEVKRIGVVGCGLMGSGIAEVCARSGYSTIVLEVNQQFLDKGMNSNVRSGSKAALDSHCFRPEADISEKVPQSGEAITARAQSALIGRSTNGSTIGDTSSDSSSLRPSRLPKTTTNTTFSMRPLSLSRKKRCHSKHDC